MRKAVIIGAVTLVAALIIVCLIPFSRSYNCKMVIQANPALVYRKILQNADWRNWYAPVGFSTRLPSAISPIKHDELLAYNMEERKQEISGKVRLNISLEGGTYLDWNETVYLTGGIGEKINFLFRPSAHASALRQSLKQLKEDLESSTEQKAGVHFKVYQMKGHVIAALDDTVLTSQANAKLLELYKKIRTAFPVEEFTDTGRFTSRYEAVDESRIKLQAGLRMKNPLIRIPPPLKRLEVPSVLVAVVSAEMPYQKASELEQITHGWVSKNNLKLATSIWFEHGVQGQKQAFQLKDTLRVIQPFYYWPQPVQDIY